MVLRRTLATAALLAVPPVGLSVLFENIVRRNVFRTGRYERGVPEAIGVPFEQVPFWAVDGHEHEGWLFRGGDSPATLLFMHGTNYNASDMWLTEERAQLFGGFLRGIGCNFFVFDYRGYGQSDSETTEQGTYLDAEGALACLHNRSDIDASRIVFYGFSLGTGVATELALREPSAGLILRAPYTSMREMVRWRYPKMRVPLAVAPWLPRTRYDSAAKISRVRVPVLIMHGDADERVPYEMGRRLYDLAPEPKTFVTFPGAAHADFPLDLMVPAIRRFLEQTTPEAASAR
jgi:fermentation-respiration switch protein FrsA (DUF1100 family)